MKLHICLPLFMLVFNVQVNSLNVSVDNDKKFHEFFNFGSKKVHKTIKSDLKSEHKVDVLGAVLKKYINSIKEHPKLDIVFLIDSSSSVGQYNFKSELKFVKKLLSDVIVDYNHTRIAVVAFSSSNNILKNIDEISKTATNYSKCSLLTKQLKSIRYRGGDTFTLGALKKAKEIFDSSNRNDSKKVLFLITDACLKGTYSDGPNTCLPCPDPFHTTTVPAFGIESCKCKEGYKATANRECKEMKCPKMTAPKNAYYVKNRSCPIVIFSACAIRCEVGYSLRGTSIRLCQLNGTWSGEEPKCEIKSCSPLDVPIHGKIQCSNPDMKKNFKNVTSALPVDTICKFKCDEGYILSGSKDRTCLPITKWSGLKTSCKPLKCKKLQTLKNGDVNPKSCQSGMQEYGKVCKYTCKEGFQLDGPSERRCTGKNMMWNTSKKVKCKDVSPPNITCPEDITDYTLPGKKFGHVNWTKPIATDNQDQNVSMWIKPTIKNIQSYKFQIGSTKVTYFAQDAFQNKANCSFHIVIKDNEAPKFENCVDPPTYLTGDPTGANITWEEPNVFDNSQNFTLYKSHHFGFFPLGTTTVNYTAVDSSNNSNVCLMNITIEASRCEPLPDPQNGRSVCLNEMDGLRCLITCDEGYSIPVTEVTEKDNETFFVCNDASPVWYSESGFTFADCSETHIPNEIQVGEVIIPDVVNCSDLQNIENIKNDVKLFINNEFCTDNCTLTSEVDCKNEEAAEIFKNNTIVKREAKRTRTKNRVRVKYQLKRKFRNRNKITPNSKIQLRNGHKASIHYELKINCSRGSVQRKKKCVYCPKGTFHNETRKACQSCPFGQYNDKIGRVSCIQCPLHHSTRKLRSKKLDDCKEQCPPGTHAKRKIQRMYKRIHNVTIEKTTLKPFCYSCHIGYYQPNFGELKCLPCPEGYTTTTIGSSSIEQCIPKADKLCQNNVCIHGICSVVNDYEFSCNCFERFIGAHCEYELDLCKSYPCYNGGTCIYSNNDFMCFCTEGYKGKFCEDLIEEQTSPCLNNGAFYLDENGTSICICPSGYTGDICQIKIDMCKHFSCENNSTCIDDGDRISCKCTGGFIGSRCHLLPCDYKPCPETKICINTYEDNSTINSYLCSCPDGFTGENCDEKINYCNSSPCLNGGTCINEILNYTCLCSSLYYGNNCEIRRSTNYILNFNSYTTSSFVKLKPFAKNLTDISVCLWIQTLDDINYGTIISYATPSFDNAFTITDYTGLVLYINNQYVVTDIHLNDGLWHHVCVSWSTNGSYSIYVDSRLTKVGENFQKGDVIQSKGSLILGQDQDVFGGEFSQSESFVGKLTYLDIWSRVLTQEEVVAHFANCEDTFLGNIYAWPEIREFVQRDVQVEISDFCKTCEPKTLYNGYIEVINNTAYYSCYTGFTLSNPKFASGRKCTKASYWEGYYEPFCSRKYCGYPGSVRNGYTLDKRYYFEDKINFYCYEGYNMIGNRTIRCNEHGFWIPDKPRCIGTSCIAFKKPLNSELSIMSDQSYEDYKENYTQFDIGTQIEINCLNEYELIGENLLTCLENGTWDFLPPKCSPKQIPKPKKPECSIDQIPKAPLNGFIDMDSYYKVVNGTSQIIEYKCLNEYTLIGENSSSCILDGYWSEPKITCKKIITCGMYPRYKYMKPVLQQNATSFQNEDKIYFKCIDGYVEFGSSFFIRCLESGKWSRLQGKCRIKSCGRPTIADDTVLKGGSYLFGDTVELKCKSGSSYVLTCNKNGVWDGDKDETC